MLLLGVSEENGWLASTFNLTYAVGWDKICKAVSMIYSYYENVEILIDNEKIDISSKEDILKLEEAGNMTIRGISTIIKVPIMITFFNQLQTVNVAVPCMKGEFEKADYQKFNMSLGQYMDSLELAMYR
ncbi:MAG: hypothetical protein ACOXZ9_06260 [Bacteroidales bacterium]|jgi:hypothetical protein